MAFVCGANQHLLGPCVGAWDGAEVNEFGCLDAKGASNDDGEIRAGDSRCVGIMEFDAQDFRAWPAV